MQKIKNVFVLVMENRSFDHLFGFSGLPGVSPPPNAKFKPGAPDQLKNDPPHEFEDVKGQINNGKMDGFSGDAVYGLLPERIPHLMELAQTFLLMDNWFCSMPGPTWPNRLFVHGASSCGLDNSLKFNELADAVYNPDLYLSLPKGHIFERCHDKGLSWRVYKTDRFVQALGMRGMVDAAMAPGNKNKFFRDTTRLASDLAKGDAAQYTFIEPYHAPPSFSSGNSQHPVGSVAAGDEFIYQVYSAIRNSPLWANSLLIVTWNEHGGFYDHVAPPKAPPPGESAAQQAVNHKRESRPGDCKFDTLGPRVPTLVISPFAPRGLGSKLFPGKVFDHASIISSLRETFSLGEPLTARDAWAPTWLSALLAAPRTDIGLPKKIGKFSVRAPEVMDIEGASGRPDGNLAGFALVAADVDRYIAKHSGTAPLISSTFAAKLPKAALALADPALAVASKRTPHKTVLAYLAAVHARVGQCEKLQRSVDVTSYVVDQHVAKPKGAKKSSFKAKRKIKLGS